MKRRLPDLISRQIALNLLLILLTVAGVSCAQIIQYPLTVTVAANDAHRQNINQPAGSISPARATIIELVFTPTPTWAPPITPTILEQSESLPIQLLNALNQYRQAKGVNPLAWDNNLAQLAQERANLFSEQGGLDNHQGFQLFTSNPDNFARLKVTALGENSSYGFNLEAVSLIEQVFTSDELHNSNQLNPDWNLVGIGTMGSAVNLIFGQSL